MPSEIPCDTLRVCGTGLCRFTALGLTIPARALSSALEPTPRIAGAGGSAGSSAAAAGVELLERSFFTTMGSCDLVAGLAFVARAGAAIAAEGFGEGVLPLDAAATGPASCPWSSTISDGVVLACLAGET